MSVPARRTIAHTATQLVQAMDITADQFARAHAAGLVPDPDMKTPRWSGPVVDDLVARRQEILEAIPDDLDEQQLREALGMSWGDWKRAWEADLIPAPDRGEFWTRPLAEEIIGRAEQLRATTPPQPLGATRCAELLAEATGVEVAVDDVLTLAELGHTEIVDYYKKWALYDVGRLQALVATEEGRHLVVDVAAERTAWLTGSIEPREAARFLNWREGDLARVAAERGITTGRFGRYRRTDIAALSGDEDLMEEVRREQLLGPEQAAQHLEMRRVDFEYVVAAGWVRPTRHVTREVGRRKAVEVPLYRTADVEDVLEVPGVDWEAVRAVKAGEVSPLREHTRLPATRATAVRAFCAQLSADHAVEVWPHWWNAGDRWEIDWEIREDGHPTKSEVAAVLAAHHGARRYADQITLSTQVGEVIRWARHCQHPGQAVVVDTETTGLHGAVMVEIAVLDAYDGRVLLDTLVHPGGAVVEPGARAVHGITDAELEHAPTWGEVLPRFLEAVAGRRILAYNAPFDRAAVAATHVHAGLEQTELPAATRWECLMQARSVWARVGRWLPLGGGHRALGDARDALRVLQAIGTPRPN
ncbi:3'-5' exonuclease [Streptosporangium sp. NPDC051022]|uniref:3'-5' exonuclease n=1 Tax=Streptosporangium sp. NPDC051022 TaxID=3155752 RepID=UPI00343AAC97